MYDDLVDIKKGADFSTLSCNKFSNQDKSILIGANDSVDDEYHITLIAIHRTTHATYANEQVRILNNLYESVKYITGLSYPQSFVFLKIGGSLCTYQLQMISNIAQVPLFSFQIRLRQWMAVNPFGGQD